MPEKVKITKKEFEEMYELIPDIEDKQNIPEKESDDKNANFEVYTENFDSIEEADAN